MIVIDYNSFFYLYFLKKENIFFPKLHGWKKNQKTLAFKDLFRFTLLLDGIQKKVTRNYM